MVQLTPAHIHRFLPEGVLPFPPCIMMTRENGTLPYLYDSTSGTRNIPDHLWGSHQDSWLIKLAPSLQSLPESSHAWLFQVTGRARDSHRNRVKAMPWWLISHFRGSVVPSFNTYWWKSHSAQPCVRQRQRQTHTVLHGPCFLGA